MVNKCQVVLCIYDALLKEGELLMDSVLAEFNISSRTFRRYISEINSFLYNNYKNQVVKYSKLTNKYKLVKMQINAPM